MAIQSNNGEHSLENLIVLDNFNYFTFQVKDRIRNIWCVHPSEIHTFCLIEIMDMLQIKGKEV